MKKVALGILVIGAIILAIVVLGEVQDQDTESSKEAPAQTSESSQ